MPRRTSYWIRLLLQQKDKKMTTGEFNAEELTRDYAFKQFKDNGGASFQWHEGLMAEIKDGYMVGGASKEVTLKSDMIDPELFECMWEYFINKYSSLSSSEDIQLGIWNRTSDGALVMSLSTWFDNELSAVESTVSRRQKAYFDVKRNKTIYVL